MGDIADPDGAGTDGTSLLLMLMVSLFAAALFV